MKSEKALVKALYAYLSDEGFRPHIDDDGDLSFKAEGFSFYVIVDPDDEQFFSLVLPGIHRIDADEAIELRTLRVMSALSRSTKAIKLVADDDGRQVHAIFETVLPRPEAGPDPAAFGTVLMRGVDALKFARTRLREAMAAAE